MRYQSPNVYIEETSLLPPSVAEVSTAIPAFIGYTEKALNNNNDLTNRPVRISSLLEYINLFGGAKTTSFTVKITSNEVTTVTYTQPEYLMYYSLQMFFANGGGACYILSVGNYEKTFARTDIEKGLDILRTEDEPTLILIPDVKKLSAIDYGTLCAKVLQQCADLKDRFGIFDVLEVNTDSTKTMQEQSISTFRDKVGNNNLKYGAAYFPYLKTNLQHDYEDKDVRIDPPITTAGSTTTTTTTTPAPSAQTLSDIKASNTELYNKIKTAVDKERITLPPSSAIAGVYATVDRERGVWKAPANVSLAAVIGPTVKLTDKEQNGFNIDPTAGKSINAIRSFTGKGTLVWGARTLAGNDNEWRYIPVRRLFNLIEESLQKATAFAVFEPNNAMTWLKIQTMTRSYLDELWRNGALAGATPEQAYFVNVGLGQTMIEQDILEGRLIVEIGVAAVRPAEFIILRFSHKLQQS